MSNIESFRLSAIAPETKYQEGLEKTLDDYMKKLREILNSGILFADNFDSYIATVLTDATAGVETAIAHGLGRIPSGFLVLEQNKAAIIYKGATGKTATTYYIVSNTASVTATLMFF